MSKKIFCLFCCGMVLIALVLIHVINYLGITQYIENIQTQLTTPGTDIIDNIPDNTRFYLNGSIMNKEEFESAVGEHKMSSISLEPTALYLGNKEVGLLSAKISFIGWISLGGEESIEISFTTYISRRSLCRWEDKGIK